MSAPTRKLQDMPPPGGYKCLKFERNPAKTVVKGSTLVALFLGCTLGGAYLYSLNKKKIRRDEIERRSSMLAILPLLLAEKHRAALKQWRRNRDEEERVMANVPGWVVGTLWGEPRFKTLPPNTWVEPDISSFYTHASRAAAEERIFFKLNTF